MDNIKTAINLLEAVRATLDTISVSGIENQSRFVGCAEAIQTVSQTLTKFMQESQTKSTAEQKEEVNG